LTGRQTYSERRWPNTPEFNSALFSLKEAGSVVLLQLVWKAYDNFCARALSKVDCCREDEDLERDITEQLELDVREVMTGYEPFDVQHGPYERETRAVPPAQPPQYDIAFKLRMYPRVMWPLEAKVLRTDGRVGEYVGEIRQNFLTCRYSPFSNEAAMLGYLLSGDPEIALSNIADKGGWNLGPHPDFLDREHRTSDHMRKVQRGKSYPSKFRCHHLIFQLQMS